MSYDVPKNLLSVNNNKTIKGQKKGVRTYIMYLSPHKDNSRGVNLCPKASAGCAKACLFNSGAARFNRVQAGKRNKTEYFLADMGGYMAQLDKEITAITAREAKKGEFDVAIRLNGTTDFRFENLIVRDGKNIFELHPTIQFYDYTKIAKRFTVEMPKNYHLTFSRSETNHKEVVEVLANGGNVAVVFEEKPEFYLGYPVIDGDESDLRFMDEKNVVIGLTYKRASVKGGGEINDDAINSGFVVTNEMLKVTPKMVKVAVNKVVIDEKTGKKWLKVA
ncbi:MAG: hypothetical protein WD512_20560 [Candidatus Paceibacterota bacterium]